MVILKTLVGNLSANVNEITFTDNIIDSNSIIEVYYNNNDIYTVETWQREHTIGIVTSDHDFPVSVKVLINNVVAFSPYDDSELLSRLSSDEDDITALDGRLDTAEDNITLLNSNKQDKLTAGDNITIENNIISASPSSLSESILLLNTNYAPTSGTSLVTKNYELNDSINNYDGIIVYAYVFNNGVTQSNIMNMYINKSDYFDKSYDSGQPSDVAFMLNATTNDSRRSFIFGFTDETHIQTKAIRTEVNVEPVIYKVVGFKF